MRDKQLRKSFAGARKQLQLPEPEEFREPSAPDVERNAREHE
jgi:hypothetical protein